jgi:hypothetical protein
MSTVNLYSVSSQSHYTASTHIVSAKVFNGNLYVLHVPTTGTVVYVGILTSTGITPVYSFDVGVSINNTTCGYLGGNNTLVGGYVYSLLSGTVLVRWNATHGAVINSLSTTVNVFFANGNPILPAYSIGNVGAFCHGIAQSGNTTYLSIADGSIFKSIDGGLSWTSVPTTHNGSLSAVNGRLFVNDYYYGGLYRTADNGSTWTPISLNSCTLAIQGTAIIGTDNTASFESSSFQGGTHVYRSTDYGDNWTDITSNLPVVTNGVWALGSDGTNIYAYIYGHGLYVSSDNGGSWTIISNPADGDYLIYYGHTGGSYKLYNGCIFTSSSHPEVFLNGQLYTTDNGATWDTLPSTPDTWNPFGTVSRIAIGRTIFIQTMENASTIVFRTLDFGVTWEDIRFLDTSAYGFYGISGIPSSPVYNKIDFLGGETAQSSIVQDFFVKDGGSVDTFGMTYVNPGVFYFENGVNIIRLLGSYTKTSAETTSVPLSTIAYDSTNKILYIVSKNNYTSGSAVVNVINLSVTTEESTDLVFTQFIASSFGIRNVFCVDVSGNYWFSNGSDTVWIFNSKGILLHKYASTYPYLQGPILVPSTSGGVWASGSGGSFGLWTHLNLDGTYTQITGSESSPIGNNSRHGGVAINGHLCYCLGVHNVASSNFYLYKVDFTALTITAIVSGVGFGNGTNYDMAYCTSNNTIWLFNSDAGGYIKVYNTSGTLLTTISSMPTRVGNASWDCEWITYDSLTNRIIVIGDAGVIKEINPSTYAITDLSSLIPATYVPANVNSDGIGGVWISFYGGGTQYIGRLYNGIINTYSPATNGDNGYGRKIVYNSISNQIAVKTTSGFDLTNEYPNPLPISEARVKMETDKSIIGITGNVTSEGDSSVTERGVCWSLSAYPTINDAHESHGSGAGEFSADISAEQYSLTPWTTYYFRVYATNSYGTSYSNQITGASEHWDILQYNYTLADRGYYYIETDAGHYANSMQGIYVGGDDGGIIQLPGLSYLCDQVPPPPKRGPSRSESLSTGEITTQDKWQNSPMLTAPVPYSDWDYANRIFGIKRQTDDFATQNICTINNPGGAYYSFPYFISRVAGYGSESTFINWIPSATDGAVFNYFPPYNILWIGSRGGWANISPYNYSLFGFPIINAILFVLVKTEEATFITNSGAVCTGLIDNTPMPLGEAGVCFSKTNPSPTLSDGYTISPDSGVINSTLTNLDSGTTYYIRGYVKTTNHNGQTVVCYGTSTSFITDAITETVNSATSIGGIKATISSTVTYLGVNSIIDKGVVYATHTNPTFADSHVSNGSGAGTYSSSLTGLSLNTTYYVRAYATTSYGTFYSDQVEELSFTTRTTSLAIVTTANASNILGTLATSGGEVTDEGDSSVTQKGVCINATGTPTTADTVFSDGVGLGIFVSSISGLQNATTYYVRAYSTNSFGTSYGNEISFLTKHVVYHTYTITAKNVVGETSTTISIGIKPNPF